jgi:membrane protease YdiL (CAAX protease family)
VVFQTWVLRIVFWCGATASFGKDARALKDLAKIFGYLAGVLILGALLAPPLYWAGQWLAAHGIPALGAFKFQKYFNRAAMISAVLLLWPVVRSLRITGWSDLGLERDRRWWQHLLGGFLIAGLAVAIMAFFYTQFGIYRIRDVIAWGRIPMIALGAVAVAFVEELLFRGGILGLFRRTMRPMAALFWVTALFAIVHFLKPDDSFDITEVGWLSGFALIPHTFHQFAEPMDLLAGFTTLFVLGWLCGDATLRTRALWLSIGLHAGVVLVKMSYSAMAKFSVKQKFRADYLPWVDEKFETGLVPVAVLLLAWGVVRLWLAYENRLNNSPRG